VAQEMADVERKLSDLQREQFKAKELELKTAQNRQSAIKELEESVT